MNASQVTRFFREHLLGLCLLAIAMGLITNLIYDAVKDRKETLQVAPPIDEKEKTETKMAEERHLLASKQAIQNHLRKFGVENKKVKGIKPSSPAEARQRLHKLYDALLEIPTYDCPDDYRQAYQKVLEQYEKLVNFLESVPISNLEWLVEAMKDGQNLDPGGTDRIRQETFNAIFRQIRDALQELDAVAFRYGVR